MQTGKEEDAVFARITRCVFGLFDVRDLPLFQCLRVIRIAGEVEHQCGPVVVTQATAQIILILLGNDVRTGIGFDAPDDAGVPLDFGEEQLLLVLAHLIYRLHVTQKIVVCSQETALADDSLQATSQLTIFFHYLCNEIRIQGLTDKCLNKYFEMILVLGRASGWGQLRLVQQYDVSSTADIQHFMSLSACFYHQLTG